MKKYFYYTGYVMEREKRQKEKSLRCVVDWLVIYQLQMDLTFFLPIEVT